MKHRLWLWAREGAYHGWNAVEQDGKKGVLFSGAVPGIGYYYIFYIGDDGELSLSCDKRL